MEQAEASEGVDAAAAASSVKAEVGYYFFEIEKLEGRLKTDTENVTFLGQLCDLCIKADKRDKALDYAIHGLEAFEHSPGAVAAGLAMSEAAIRVWQHLKYVKKESIRINLSAERAALLLKIRSVLTLLARLQDKELHEIISLKLAYVKECSGALQDAISILSDLITAQAHHGVDLSYIILRAAVLIKHMGGLDQAIEYLEFLQDDPPVESGYGKTHVLALLVLVLEQVKGFKRDEGAIISNYDNLKTIYIQEMTATGKTLRRQEEIRSKLETQFMQKLISKSSEIWEQLALQAVDRCEYVAAAEFLQQAIDKAPTKSRLLHLLAEVFVVINQRERAARVAERVYIMQPQSAEIRNLLLSLSPEKWGEKMRSVMSSVDGQQSSMSEDRKIALTKGAKAKRVEEALEQHQEAGWFDLLQSTVNNLTRSSKDTHEARTKAAEEKKKSDEKKAAKEKRRKEKEAQEKAAAEAASQVAKAKKNIASKTILKDLPSRLKKPEVDAAAMKVLRKVLSGNENVYLYNPVLRELAEIRKASIMQMQTQSGGMMG